MNNDKKIIQFIPECYGDTHLIEFLKVSIKIMNHAYGISKVGKAMENQQKFFHKILIGIVDNDKKNTPRYFDDFVELKNENNLILKQKPDTNQYLIIICPELEQWLLTSASQVNINPENFNLPDNPKKLHNISQKTDVAKNQDFTDFLQAIKNAGSPNFAKLQEWLVEFKNDIK
ncbi:MAG: hypothetical protein MUE85_03945 [Microscillaceae bacterium]|jgi:hypothetical protein|nr:hypothetical protein [Microscillaceae bacterium]